MYTESFYHIQLITILGFLIIGFIIAAMFGYSVGVYLNRNKRHKDEVSNFVPSTVLGLLALILGFTLSMAVSRYDNRKFLVLREANAIGTAYLRADFLSEPVRSRMKGNLKKYLDERIQFYDVGFDFNKIQEVQNRTDKIQQSIWQDVAKLTHQDSRVVLNLFVSAINELIDISGERRFATDNHVPELVYLIIITIAVIGLTSVGYVEGANKKSRRFGVILLSVLFALVIVLIQDLDRPRRGLIKVDQQSFYLLKSSLK